MQIYLLIMLIVFLSHAVNVYYRYYCKINDKKIKTHCNGDSYNPKTTNIILPGLVIKHRWTPFTGCAVAQHCY